jgi:hypothetical protein
MSANGKSTQIANPPDATGFPDPRITIFAQHTDKRKNIRSTETSERMSETAGEVRP